MGCAAEGPRVFTVGTTHWGWQNPVLLYPTCCWAWVSALRYGILVLRGSQDTGQLMSRFLVLH